MILILSGSSSHDPHVATTISDTATNASYMNAGAEHLKRFGITLADLKETPNIAEHEKPGGYGDHPVSAVGQVTFVYYCYKAGVPVGLITFLLTHDLPKGLDFLVGYYDLVMMGIVAADADETKDKNSREYALTAFAPAFAPDGGEMQQAIQQGRILDQALATQLQEGRRQEHRIA
jgi:hypothetical protein